MVMPMNPNDDFLEDLYDSKWLTDDDYEEIEVEEYYDDFEFEDEDLDEDSPF